MKFVFTILLVLALGALAVLEFGSPSARPVSLEAPQAAALEPHGGRPPGGPAIGSLVSAEAVERITAEPAEAAMLEPASDSALVPVSVTVLESGQGGRERGRPRYDSGPRGSAQGVPSSRKGAFASRARRRGSRAGPTVP